MTENLLPLWTGHELTEDETVELLEECEGDNFKGRIFMNSNKKTVILNTKVQVLVLVLASQLGKGISNTTN